MSINLLPDVGGPVLVKGVRIFEEENIVEGNLGVAIFYRPDRGCVALAVQGKAGQPLPHPGSLWGNISYNNFSNRDLPQRQQYSRLMLEICLVPRDIVRIVSEAMADLHPYWLLGQLPRRLQIMNRPGRHEVVALFQGGLPLWAGVLPHRLVSLVHDVCSAPAAKHNGSCQKDLQFFHNPKRSFHVRNCTLTTPA